MLRLALLSLLLLTGCAHPHIQNYRIPVVCVEEVRLIDCDLASPPHCKQSVTRYKQGCEELVVK